MQPYYPVADCYATVQGEGVRTAGEPIILVRFSTLDAWNNAHIQTTRQTPHRVVSLGELITEIDELLRANPVIKVIHLTGDEPMLNDVGTLISHFVWAKEVTTKISLDTCGAFALHRDFIKALHHLSIGPKPRLPLNSDMYVSAHELRYYIKNDDPTFEALLKDHNPDKSKALIIPYSLSQEDIDATLKVCLESGLRFHLPTYRTVPAFDANLNGGSVCDICLRQDGVKPLLSEEGAALMAEELIESRFGPKPYKSEETLPDGRLVYKASL